MDARPEQFQIRYKRNWRQQKFGSFREYYESHGLQRNQTKQCYNKLIQNKSLINKIRKSPATFFWPCDEKRETGKIERKQCEKMLDGLTKWLKVGIKTDALKMARDRDAWKVMITYAKEHGID